MSIFTKTFLKCKHSYFLERIRAALFFNYYIKRNVVRVEKTPGKGDGLFTNVNLRKEGVIFVAPGPTRITQFEGNDCYLFPDWYGVDKDTWIDIQFPFIKINHSCDPNIGIYSSRCFVALRDIKQNEELTLDYSSTDDEESWVMGPGSPVECACGTKNCRKYIGPIQTLSSEQIKKLYPYIPKYFLRKYVTNHTELAGGRVAGYTQNQAKFTDLYS